MTKRKRGTQPKQAMPAITTVKEITTIHESVPVPSAAQQSSGNGDLWAQIRPNFSGISERIRPQIELVPKLLFTLWNMSLLLGGLIFVIYFASIGFMPEIDPTASVTLLSVSAITGAFLLIAVGISLIAPSYVWVRWTINHSTLKLLWCDKEEKFSRLRAILWFTLPLIVFIGGIFSIYLVEKQWHPYFFWSGLVVSSIIALAVASIFLWKQSQKWQALVLLLISIFSSAFTILPMILILLTLIGTSPNLRLDTIGATLQVIYIIMTIFFMLSVNASLVGSRGVRRLSFFEYIVLTAVSIFVLLTITSSTAYIPKRVMNVYQFGFIPALIVLDNTGCTIIDNYNIPSSRHNDTCKVSEVTIHSRLGSTYYVQVNSNDDTPVCLTIPSEHVLSWAIKSPKKGTVWPPKQCL